MAVVTIAAGRRTYFTFQMRDAMHARAIAGGLFLVTNRASCGPGRLVVIGMFVRDIGVAARAGIRLVNGCLEFGQVNEDGNFFARRRRFGERFVRMTFHAIAVLQGSSETA